MATKSKTVAKKRVGRPATGLSSNKAEYRQTSLWLRKDTLTKTLRSLVSPEGVRVQLSGLVQVLLDDWLDSKRGKGKIPEALLRSKQT